MLKSQFSKISLVFLVVTMIAIAALAVRPTVEPSFDKAYEAWDTGDYITALQGFDALLRGPNSDVYFERITLLTGELYEVTSIARDGRNLQFSPDGCLASYETGSGPTQTVHLLDAADGCKPLAEFKGRNASFSPSGSLLAFSRVSDTPEMEKLRKDLADASTAAKDYSLIMDLRTRLTVLEAKTGEIVVRNAAIGQESVLPTGGLFKGGFVFSADGREIYFVGAGESDTASNDIYAVGANQATSGAAPRKLTSGPGFKIFPNAVPGGKFLAYIETTRNPFPRQPVTPSTGAGRPRGGGAGLTRRFSILSLADGSAKMFEGASPAFSSDGSMVAYIGREGVENVLYVMKLDGDWKPSAAKKTTETISSVSFSPDGSGIAYEMTWTGNAEIYVSGIDGRDTLRLTHDVQDDRTPRFLSPKLVLAVKGESRYARAYLYDIETMTATRLFHNNTVRTLSFEYEWAPDPSGQCILISAQRNGDTMVNERGVFLLDLDRKITRDALLARIQANLASEKALKAKGEAMFKPIAANVRAVISSVSTTRIYGYEEALFNFDSKHVTLPGNSKAAEYIFKTFESFGYKPEYQWLPNRPMKTANVIAVLKGTENPDLYYVLSSHYDSLATNSGADDDISATAALLETARVLAGKPLPSSVIFAVFTGEESGLWGSAEFARAGKEKGLKVMAGLNNDVVGWMNDNRYDDTIRYSNAGIRDVEHAAAMGFTKLITYDTHYVKSTDAASLYDVWGDIMGGLGSYPLLGSPHYHQASDVLETVNHQLVTEVAKFNTASIMLLASSPSPVKGLMVTNRGADWVELSWTANPEEGITDYLVTWAFEGKAAAGSKKVKDHRIRLRVKTGAEKNLAVTVRALNKLQLQSWGEAEIDSQQISRAQ